MLCVSAVARQLRANCPVRLIFLLLLLLLVALSQQSPDSSYEFTSIKEFRSEVAIAYHHFAATLPGYRQTVKREIAEALLSFEQEIKPFRDAVENMPHDIRDSYNGMAGSWHGERTKVEERSNELNRTTVEAWSEAK